MSKQKAPGEGVSVLCGCVGGLPSLSQVTEPFVSKRFGGGGGEITQGIMRAQRQQSWVGDADIFVGGHWHVDWITRMERLRLSSTGVVYRDTVTHMALPSLKDEYDMSGGFHVERGRAPRPQGAYWLTFRHNSAEHGRVDFDVSRAGA